MTFEDYLKEEMEEVGEVNVAFLVPHYLEISRGVSLAVPLDSHPSNYNLTAQDFVAFSSIVKKMVRDMDWHLYEWDSAGGPLWEDCLLPLPDERLMQMLGEITVWRSPDTLKGLFLSYPEPRDPDSVRKR
jgi:hypothetical protein